MELGWELGEGVQRIGEARRGKARRMCGERGAWYYWEEGWARIRSHWIRECGGGRKGREGRGGEGWRKGGEKKCRVVGADVYTGPRQNYDGRVG